MSVPAITWTGAEGNSEGLFQTKGTFAKLVCRGEGIEPSWIPRAGNSSHDHTGWPEVTEAIVWTKQGHGTRWSRESGSGTRNTSRRSSGTSGTSSRPTRTRCTNLLRVPKGLRQGVGGLELVLLGHLRVDRRGLDAGVAELLLDDLQIVAACSVQVGGLGVPAGVGGVPGIQAHGRHETLDHPPDPVAGKRSPLARENWGVG
jgi:hypothetical protein